MRESLSQWWCVKLFSFDVMLGEIYSDPHSNEGYRFPSGQPKKNPKVLEFL